MRRSATTPRRGRLPRAVAVALRAAAACATSACASLAVAGAACAPEPTSGPCARCEAPAFPAGTTPNDVALSRCAGRTVALVADSGESRLHAIAIDDGALVASTIFDVEPGATGGRSASPWAVAVTPDGARAAVTLFGQDRVAWVDPCAGRVLSTTTAPGNVTPQPVVIAGARVIAAFTNVRTFSYAGEAPELDAGVIAAFRTDGDTLVLEREATLPCTNPQGLTLASPEVIVSCSGPLARGPDGGQAPVADGAVLRVDAATLVVKRQHTAARLAPGTATIIDRHIVAGSLVDPVLLIAPAEDAGDAPIGVGVELPGAPVDALFEAARWDDHTAIITQFTTDALHVVALEETADGVGRVPAVRATIPTGPGGAAFRGLLAVDVRGDLAMDGDSVDAVALLGLSAEIVPLRLSSVIEELEAVVDDTQAGGAHADEAGQ